MMPLDGTGELEDLLPHEWLLTNTLGGYACSTAACLNTRKYHGLLVASMAPPVKRLVLLSRVEETVRQSGWHFPLACSEYPGAIHPHGFQLLHGFAHHPFPRWLYKGEGWTVEKTLRLLKGQNTVILSYTLLEARDPVELELRPLMALRPIHELMYQWNAPLEAASRGKNQHRIPPTCRTPEVFFAHDGAFAPRGMWYFNTIYRRESERGYAGLEDLWSPGSVKWPLEPGQTVHFACSSEPIDLSSTMYALDVQTDEQPLLGAAKKFIIDLPQDRAARYPSLLSSFPWSAPSTREALIALPGLLLCRGEFARARQLLGCLAGQLREGLVPSHFPESAGEPVYLSADVSLWFIYALAAYARYTRDDSPVMHGLLEKAIEIIDYYRRGTGLGIFADAEGLLAVRPTGGRATWMDAVLGDWVVTPRRGRPVEINALWHNALYATAHLAERFGLSDKAREFSTLATLSAVSFNKRFWNTASNCCFDVVDDHTVDPSIRPNQLLAISLPHPVLSSDRHAALLEAVRSHLLTPVGLRTLSPHDPSYHGRYRGDVVQRERALHQGSVFPWLLGPWADAQVRVFGSNAATRAAIVRQLQPCMDQLERFGMLGELFDGDAPHAPGGAIASAAATGEVLRAHTEYVLGQTPKPSPRVVRFDNCAAITLPIVERA